MAAELVRTGEIARVGGSPYLHTLVASVPTAAHAEYYARIVKEKATLRSLIFSAKKILASELMYALDMDEDEAEQHLDDLLAESAGAKV